MVMLVYRDSSMYVYRLLSTDVKPMGCPNDSRAIEIDTGKRYIYDAHNGLWQDAITSFSDEIDIDTYTKEQTQALLDTKVDKVTGMGLSQESFTTTEKEKLASMSVITVDTNPTSGSQNAVSSGGVYTALAGKQDSLTFDNTPTSGSSNPVKSGGVYTALSGKADKTDTVSTVTYDTTGAPILKQTINGTTTTIETPDTTPTNGSKHLISSGGVAASVEAVIGAGSKNLLKTMKSSGSFASGSVLVINNGDGTFTLSGTASAAASWVGACQFADVPTKYIGKTVRLTGGVSDKIRLAIYPTTTASTASYVDDGDGVNFVLTQEMISTPYDIRIAVKSGAVCDDVIIKPMLRLADIPGDEFQPYAPPNWDLATKNAANVIANNGCKNLLKYRRADNTLNGVTFTNNTDGSISLSGTATTAFARQGTCLLSDLPTSMIGRRVRLTGTYSENIRLRVFSNSTTTSASYTDEGNGVEFTITSEMISNPYQIRISIINGTDCSGVTIYPMLRDASIPGDDYQPYAPTNYELYQMVLALQSATSLSMSASPGGSETREILNKTEKSDEVEEPKEVEELDSIPEPDEKDIRDER